MTPKELEEKRKAAEAAAHDTDTDDGGDGAKSGRPSEDEAEGGLKLDLATTKAQLSSEEPTPSRSRVTSPKEDQEDWKKFLSLTSGVDSLIQKSKSDLQEIKQDSYYQAKKEKLHDDTKEAKEKKAKQKKKKAWVDLDAEGFEDHDGEVVDEKEREKELAGEESSSESEEGGDPEAEVDAAAGEQVEREAEEGEEEGKEAEEGEKKPELFKEPSVEEYVDPDEDDALFNTDFVTDITTGKVQLAVRTLH